jgi:hypothetical protein
MSAMLFDEPGAIGLISAVVVAFIVASNELGSISNNDVPMLFVELIGVHSPQARCESACSADGAPARTLVNAQFR